MKYTVFAAAMLVLLCSFAIAAVDTHVATQTFNTGVDEVALLDIEGTLSPVDLQIVAPAEAGVAPASVTSTGSDLNYTVVVDSTETKTVQVKVDSNVPAGCTLYVTAGACAVGYTGAVDTDGAAKQALTTSDADFLTAIGTCYTGDGDNKGNPLTYDLEISNWATLVSKAATATTITFTLSATD